MRVSEWWCEEDHIKETTLNERLRKPKWFPWEQILVSGAVHSLVLSGMGSNEIIRIK